MLTVLVALLASACGSGGTDESELFPAGAPSSVTVSPDPASVAIGQTLAFTATVALSDGSTITPGDGGAADTLIEWKSSDAKVATIDAHGVAKGIAAGKATITATVQGVSGTAVLTVGSAKIASIALTPAKPEVAVGLSLALQATATMTDGTTKDVTSTAKWAAADVAVATVDGKGSVEGVAVGDTEVTATQDGVKGATTVKVKAATLQSIEITPPAPTLAKGTTQQLVATGTLSDGTTQDVTAQATWSSASAAVADVATGTTTPGLVTAASVGTAKISAKIGAVTGSATVTVTAATLESLDISPPNPLIANGTTQPFVATGTYSDGTSQDLTEQVTWSSSSTGIATISNAVGTAGVATALAQGQSTIGATLGSISASTTLSVSAATLVSIEVSPATPGIANGTSQQFTATGTYSDQTTQDLTSTVTWTSSVESVATVSNASGSRGLATAETTGSTTIAATLGDVSGDTVLTVTDATLVSIAVTPPSPAIAKGTTVPFEATGTYSDGTTQNLTTQVDWFSSSGAASVSNAAGSQGLGTGLAQGQATITATLGAVSGTATMTVTAATLVKIGVTPATPSIAKGTTLPFIATATYSDTSTQDVTSTVTWSSSIPSVASISNAAGSRGVATAHTAGDTIVSATLGAVSGTASLTVTEATLVSIAVTPAAPTLAKGTTLPLHATGTYSDQSTQDVTSQVTWSATGAAAKVSNAGGTEGVVSGVAQGQSTVTATLGAVSGSTTVTVTEATLTAIDIAPVSPTLAKGTTLQLTATGTYSDGSTQDVTSTVAWSTTDGTVGTVSNASGSRGVASALAPGQTPVFAKLGTITGTTTLTVSSATLVSIAVTPASAALAKGTTRQLVATGTYSDATTQVLTGQVTWSSSGAAASVSNASGSAGLATGLAQGQATVTATLGGVSGSTVLTVTAATLTGITIAPTTPSIAKGTTLAFLATGAYSDGSTQDVTSTVTWSSTDPSIATISNAAGSRGLATAFAQGTTVIGASLGGVSGTTSLTVNAATLVTIAVTPATPVLAKGTSKPLAATGTYSDNSTQDLTGQVTWSSSAPSVASVSNAAGTAGLATAAAPGQATITAKLGAVSGSTTLTVTGATLVSIGVTPAATSIAKGSSRQFFASGTYSDQSVQDLTSVVTWGTDDGALALASNAPGSRGLVTGVAQGTTAVTATLAGVTGQTSLTVTEATLVSIAVSPPSPVLAKGTNRPFAATGLYSDNSTQDLTGQVDWSSSALAVATISPSGVATAVGQGQATITAKLGAISGTTTLTVNAATLVSIAVAPSNPSIAKGTTIQLTATATYSDTTTQDVTSSVSWSSSLSSVATVSSTPGSKGLANGASQGSTTITAAIGSVSGTTTLTVTAATLVSIAVSPGEPSIANGTTVQFHAKGTYSDGTTQDVTTLVSWSSSSGGIASVSNASGSAGLAKGLSVGQTTIEATIGAVSGSTTLTVNAVVLVSIAVTPANLTLGWFVTQQYTAVGFYSDNTSQDLTTQVTWASSNPLVAFISNAAGSQGSVLTLFGGSTSISATRDGVIGSTSLTVN